MSVNDGNMYTGVDTPQDGMFGNEKIDKATQRKLEEEKRKVAELTPKYQDIVDMVENERKVIIEFITGYVDNTKDTDDNFRAELKAAGRYRKYLDELKTKFVLLLNETKAKDE